jgi:hypothetical protein
MRAHSQTRARNESHANLLPSRSAALPHALRAQAHPPDTLPWLAGGAIMTLFVLVPAAYLYLKAKGGSSSSSRRD